jgi:mRNA interferase MazF
LVWVDFDPALGTEQSGARPALVVSATTFNALSRRSLVCPITTNPAPWPTKVFLPDGLAVKGAVLTDQVRSVDRSQRGFRVVGKVPPDVLAHVRAAIVSLMEEEPE